MSMTIACRRCPRKSHAVSKPSSSIRGRSRWSSSEKRGRWILRAETGTDRSNVGTPERAGDGASQGKAPGRARLIDGSAIARLVRDDVAREVARLRALGITPGLSVVLVGDD